MLMSVNTKIHLQVSALVEKYAEARIQPENDKDLLVLVSLAKAQKTHAALMLLAEQGYGEDAMVLCRSVLELLITVKYILADPTDQRVNRYIDHDWIERKELYENLKERQEFSFLSGEEREKLENDLQTGADSAHAKHAGYRAYQGWSDKNMAEMAAEVGEESNFKLCYQIQCGFSHSSSRSINEYVKKEDGIPAFDAGPSDKYVTMVLASAFDFHKALCLVANNFFSLGMEKDIEKIGIEGWL